MSELKAGRELDRLCAEAMGFKVAVNIWDTRSQDELTPRYDLGIVAEDGSCTQRVEQYSTLPGPCSLVKAWLRAHGGWFVDCDGYARERAFTAASKKHSAGPCATEEEAIALLALAVAQEQPR